VEQLTKNGAESAPIDVVCAAANREDGLRERCAIATEHRDQ
jgi:hypothetical protein